MSDTSRPVIEYRNPQELWVVGKMVDDTQNSWEFGGVFTTKQKAIAACHTDQYFIAPAELDVVWPDERIDPWPGAYYPHLETSDHVYIGPGVAS